jgi:peptide chain release factor 2
MKKKKKVEEYQKITENENFIWNDKQIPIEKKIEEYKKIIHDCVFFENEIILLQEISKDSNVSNKKNMEDINELFNIVQLLKKNFEQFRLNAIFSNDDKNDTILEIHSGAGGVEAQDWSEMLKNMYIKWCEKHEYKYKILSLIQGEQAGIRSCVIKISGSFSFGFLKNESGVHRLVRISPFNSQKKRQTSFAAVEVYPFSDNKIEIDISIKDLRIDTYRSSGAGGQHVNTTDSAIRITHLPSGIVVQCQDERSQHMNKEVAMNMLKGKLYAMELKRITSLRNNFVEKKGIGWGEQSRSYVLQPYQVVKDHRTGYNVNNSHQFLEGKIQEMLEYNVLYFVGLKELIKSKDLDI